MRYDNWITTPVLSCLDIRETLTFWEHLGFEVTYRQERPYQYGVVARNGHELHFVRTKGFSPATCLLLVHDIQQVYKDFCVSMKTQLGRVPQTGLPRISRMKPGQSRFTLTDVAGNSIICIDMQEKEKLDNKHKTPLQQAIDLAVQLRDFKEDYVAAAKTLDNAYIKHAASAEYLAVAELLVIRGELARVLGETEKQLDCVAMTGRLGVSDSDLQRLKELHCWTA